MDALTAYVIKNYGSLMTDKEQLAHRSLIAVEKARVSSATMAELLRRHWVSDDPEVVTLLKAGSEEFLIAVRDRILREHAEQVKLNCCPRCQVITRTPKARQCFACGHDWH